MNKFIAIIPRTLLTIVAVAASATAAAGGVNWSLNVGVGGYGYSPPPVYYAPPATHYYGHSGYPGYSNYSNYYAPPVVYGRAVPVYQPRPSVVYSTSAPVTVYGDSYRPQHSRFDHGHDRGRDHRHYHRAHPRHHYQGGYERGPREYRDYRR